MMAPDKRINILMVAPKTDINSNSGGGVHVKNNFNNLSREHNVILISGTRIERSGGDHSHYSSKISRDIPLVYLFQSLLAGMLSIYVLLSKDIDIIYERHHAFGVGVLSGALLTTPRVTEVNGALIKESKLRNPNSFLRPLLLYLFEKLTFKLANGIICVSPGVREYLLDTYNVEESKIKVIENGCDASNFTDYEDAKKKLSWPRSERYIGFVGSLTPWHGLAQVITALSYLEDDQHKYKLVIVGNGRMLSELKQLSESLDVDNKIVWEGQVPHDDVPLYVNAFDLGVILKNPKTPGSPIKLYEYMSNGLPIVATDHIDFTPHYERGYPINLANYDSPRDISDKIKEIFKREAYSEDIDSYLRSWEDVSREVSDYLQTIV